MGRIVSIDDDVNFSLCLQEKLRSYVKDEVLLFNNFDIEALENYILDLVFLDIDMNTINGIDVAKELNKRKDLPIIIFVSNQEGLIHDSLVVQPFYFIRKQYLEEDLHSAFALLATTKFRTSMKVKIGTDIINIQDMIYVESRNHHITVYTKTTTYQYRMTLTDVADILSSYQCVRIHRSYIVNMHYIERWYSTRVVLINKIEIEIGRKYQLEAKRRYQEFIVKKNM